MASLATISCQNDILLNFCEIKLITVEQFRQLMGHLPFHAKAIVATAFYAGMRRDEILSLTWDKVNLNERCIKFEVSDTKDKEPMRFLFHDLRHTFDTYMRKAGVAESVIMKITGHSTREMFDGYNTVDTEDLNEAVGRMGILLNV